MVLVSYFYLSPTVFTNYLIAVQIAADMGRFTDTNEVIINTEVRSIDVTKKGVYFAFRDQVRQRNIESCQFRLFLIEHNKF